MPSPLSGKFSVIDAMFLVAAIAPGFAMTRALPAYLGTSENFSAYHTLTTAPAGGMSSGGWSVGTPGLRFSTLGRPLDRRASYWLSHIPYWAGPCLVSLSLATAGLALLRRGDLRPGPLADRQGLATGLAVAVALASQVIRGAHYHVASGRSLANAWSYPEPDTGHFWIGLPRTAGYTVAIWWLAMACGGRRSREPGEGLSLGRALGWCWMAMAVSSEVGVWCYALNY